MYLTRNHRREEDARNSFLPAFNDDAIGHLKINSYYEMDHSKLSKKSPEQLKSIRIVMVSSKTAHSVSLRFPSIYSLRSYFNGLHQRKTVKKSILPALNEKHVMRSELAAEVLYRRIPPHEIALNRNSWSFWVGDDDVRKGRVPSLTYDTRLCSVVSKNGSCWSQLEETGMVKWGKRRRVQYLNRHVEEKKKDGEEEKYKVKVEDEDDDDKEDDGNETEGSDDDNEEDEIEYDPSGKSVQKIGNHKRKGNGNSSRRSITQTVKRSRLLDQKQIIVYKHKPKKKTAKKFIDRWSVERYKLAEKNMLKVMKEKNAVFNKPILRPALRTEARKLIGDTGLLDHLLKHMAGKIAPGGEDRFRRRHNADGAMEYWLESAELMDIRKEAGVQDPYWTPPLGWKLGDNPTQDPVCASNIREIKVDLANLKREMERLTSKKQDEDMAIVTTPTSCLTSQNLEDESLIVTTKVMYTDLVKKKDHIQEQLVIISESLRQMEELMEGLKPTETPTSGNQETELASRRTHVLEERAAKIERLKSGFTICKPGGTFLWPNMTATAAASMLSPRHLLHQDMNMIVVQTTGSATLPHQQQSISHHHIALPSPTLSSLVKPLAEKRPVVLSLPSIPYAALSPASTSKDGESAKTCADSALTYHRRHYHNQREEAKDVPKSEN